LQNITKITGGGTISNEEKEFEFELSDIKLADNFETS